MKYAVMLREDIYIGGMKFGNLRRSEGDTILFALKNIQSKSQTVSNRWTSPYAKSQHGDEYRTRFDYRGLPGYLKMDQHNPAVLTFRGQWGGKAQSENHISPGITTELSFQGPCGHRITDLDCYHLLTYFYVNHFNVYYERLPSGRAFYRETKLSEKNNAEGMSFPPSFVVPQNKEIQ